MVGTSDHPLDGNRLRVARLSCRKIKVRQESPLSGNRAQYTAGTQEASVPPA